MTSELKLKQIVEAALLAAGGPMTLDLLQEIFLEDERPDKPALRAVIQELQEDYRERGIELVEIAGGFRINVRAELAPWVSRLWEERPVRYSRAMLETLALIAYRQPITRGEIEEIRGVSVSSYIIKTMMEREWIRIVGHRDVPGHPALYATTRDFLTYFGLNSLADLPTLQEIRDLDSINRELELESPEIEVALNSGAKSEDSDKQSADTASTGESMEPERAAAQDSGGHAHTPESAAEPQTGEDCEVEKVDNQA
ncbi:MAG: SMC-Scp complex subunit ScpB [Gammaproteobacteria bacterium]|nr:SMC-Scp complex subunit ScpB [Gammaproteobacteria bacterium]